MRLNDWVCRNRPVYVSNMSICTTGPAHDVSPICLRSIHTTHTHTHMAPRAIWNYVFGQLVVHYNNVMTAATDIHLIKYKFHWIVFLFWKTNLYLSNHNWIVNHQIQFDSYIVLVEFGLWSTNTVSMFLLANKNKTNGQLEFDWVLSWWEFGMLQNTNLLSYVKGWELN